MGSVATVFPVRDQAAWEKFVEEEQIDPSRPNMIWSYMNRWVNLMEQQIQEGKTLFVAAETTWSEAYDPDLPAMTLGQFRGILKILVKFWTHGEELLQWAIEKEYLSRA